MTRRSRRSGRWRRAAGIGGTLMLAWGLAAAVSDPGAASPVAARAPVAVAAAVAPPVPVETAPPPAPPDGAALRWFDGRPVRPVRTLEMRVTAYSPDERSCAPYADGITASGYSVWTNGMRLVAADTDVLPFGTLVSVPGYDGGAVVPVLDRGGRIRGRRLDVLYGTHARARRWGVRDLAVTVWEYADGRPSEFRRPRRRP